VSPRIFNGQPADKGQFPWQVAIHIPKSDGLHFCGGALISDEWILTAGHCVRGIVLGSVDLEVDDPDRVEVNATEYVLHEEYDPYIFDNDIGAIKLLTPLTFNDYVKPIALNSDEMVSNISVIVSGWGRTSDDPDANITSQLNYANLRVISNDECQKHTSVLTPGMLCTVPDDSIQNICGGDSGGALVADLFINPTHVALVSWYKMCESDKVAGYTRTSYYRDWIKRVTQV
ncbi:Trypsin and/or DUF1986 domain containing protein, partial [Asbolus verrucosus]